MQKITSESVGRYALPPIRKFFDLVSEMKGAISLGVGEPDFVTPACARGLHLLTGTGNTHYTSNKGMPELREAICQEVSRGYGDRLRLQ